MTPSNTHLPTPPPAPAMRAGAQENRAPAAPATLLPPLVPRPSDRASSPLASARLAPDSAHAGAALRLEA